MADDEKWKSPTGAAVADDTTDKAALVPAAGVPAAAPEPEKAQGDFSPLDIPGCQSFFDASDVKSTVVDGRGVIVQIDNQVAPPAVSPADAGVEGVQNAIDYISTEDGGITLSRGNTYQMVLKLREAARASLSAGQGVARDVVPQYVIDCAGGVVSALGAAYASRVNEIAEIIEKKQPEYFATAPQSKPSEGDE